MANTNNKKVIDKDYLAKQIYIYDKEYINPIRSSKQNKIEIVSKHISLEDDYKLGLKIINEDTATRNSYLRLVNSENGDMDWVVPKEQIDYYDDKEAEELVTAKAVANFAGSNTIKILGEIKQGSWKVGNISINENDMGFGKINLNVNTIDKELTLTSSEDDWKINSLVEFATNKLSSSEITVGDNVKITEEKIKANKIAIGKISLFASEEGNLKAIKEDNALVNLEDVPVLLKELNTSKENGKGYLLINGTKYKVTTDSDAYYATIQKMVKEEADIKDEQLNNNSEEEPQS
jgi:hypothetical protein